VFKRDIEVRQIKGDGYNCAVPRWIGLFIFFHVFLTALMPPGLCSCWINPARETVHVHFGHAHAESSHSHGYLSKLSDADAGGVLPLLIIPAALLVVLLSQTNIFWRIPSALSHSREWKPKVAPPPPRGVRVSDSPNPV
jgi:hypothetical protein